MIGSIFLRSCKKKVIVLVGIEVENMGRVWLNASNVDVQRECLLHLLFLAILLGEPSFEVGCRLYSNLQIIWVM
jgi:hypothetical protein